MAGAVALDAKGYFATRLSFLISSRSITYEDVAEAVGCSRTTVSRWVHEKAEPNLTQFLKLCLYFQVKPDYLLGLMVQKKK